MVRLLLVSLGSALGGAMRYLLSLAMLRWLGSGFPFGTLTVNVVGSFLIGLIMQVGLDATLISPSTRLFLTTGVMGGLTTYSTFNYETLELLRSGSWLIGLGNLAVTGLSCLVAGWLGLVCGRAV